MIWSPYEGQFGKNPQEMIHIDKHCDHGCEQNKLNVKEWCNS